MVHALIFAGGSGVRMKSSDIPKQFLKIDGVPIIISTLRYFSANAEVDDITIVCIENWIDRLKEFLKSFEIRKVISVIPGGKTGFESIHRGLEEIYSRGEEEDIVLVCDGVRPILSKELINECIVETVKFGTAVPVTPSIDSVLFSGDGESSSQNLDRKNIYITQAPQGYRLGIIWEAHDRAMREQKEAISSADLLIQQGQEVHLFAGIRENIKVTTREDLYSLRATEYYKHFRNFAEEELSQD